MTAVPPQVTRAVLEDEFAAAVAWARRNAPAWVLSCNADELVLSVRIPHPAPGAGALTLRADLRDYRAMPPAWTFTDDSGASPKQAFPAAGPVPGGASIFHSQPVICAPFNRLAYREYRGPHGNWSGADSWMDVRGTVYAPSLADMLSVIHLHLRHSPGRMK